MDLKVSEVIITTSISILFKHLKHAAKSLHGRVMELEVKI